MTDGVLARAQSAAEPPRDSDPRAAAAVARQAEEAFYSAEFAAAAALYERAASLEPGEAFHWLGLANSRMLSLLLASGRLDAGLYAASTPLLEKTWPQPDAAVVRALWEALERTRALCQQRLARNPGDAQAHYILSASYSIEANFRLTLERKYFDALRAAGRVRDAARAALKLDPALHDANLLLGAYEFSIGSVPVAFRWMLYFGGHSGSKARGIELVEDARRHGTRSRAAALSVLGVFYFREKDYARSRERWLELQALYPRNLRVDLELARSFVKEGDLTDAVAALTRALQKLHDPGGASGHGQSAGPASSSIEEDRARFELASLLEALGRREEALTRFEQVADLPEARRLLAAHAHVRAGDICRGRGQRDRAAQHYEAARAMPFPDVQKLATQRMKLLRR